ncbi:MAG: glycosyltransferase, partial [Acetobacterium sp.]|nr:glycosyltransferase [Acetobacterium sp.]
MTEKIRPFISIIIPTYNEAGYIGRVLDDIAGQDYDPSKYEVLIADGGSQDRTREIAAEYATGKSFIKIIDNPNRYVPFGLNLAIRQSKGEVIVRMDAHSRYPQNYLSFLIEWLESLGADNVGGVWITLPSND